MFKHCLTVLVLAVASIAAAADKPQSDAAIADTVLIRLSGDREVNGGALKVDVKNGVATITGIVETQRQKDKVPKIAKKVKGVKQVVNNVTLKDRAAGK
jgi:hyperosmotically inducible periplasmic protein